MWKFCEKAEFSQQEIKWNYGILCNIPANSYRLPAKSSIIDISLVSRYASESDLYLTRKQDLCVERIKFAKSSKEILICITEAYSKPCKKSTMKFFVKIVEVFDYFHKMLLLRYLTEFEIHPWLLIARKKYLQNTYYQIIKVDQRSNCVIKYSLAAEAINASCKQLNLLLY